MKKINKYFVKALFEISKEKKKNYVNEIEKIKILFSDNNDLFFVLKNNFLPFRKKFELIDNIFSIFCSQEIINFLKILVLNQNLIDYENIFNDFIGLCNEKKHVLNGIIYSTVLLTSKDIRILEKKFSLQKKCNVKLINKIDYSLICGIKIIIDNENYEYSIASKINVIKDKVKELLN